MRRENGVLKVVERVKSQKWLAGHLSNRDGVCWFRCYFFCASRGLRNRSADNKEQVRMQVTTEIDSNRGLCTIHIEGEFVRPYDNARMQQLAVDCYNQHGCRLFLFDMREATVTGGTLAVFESGNPKGENADILRRIRTAIVHRELGPDERFYETVALNRDFSLRMFDTVTEAMDWLIGHKP